MNRQLAFATFGLALVPALSWADMSSVLDGGWRISAGAVYDSGVKTDMKFSPQQTYVSPYAVTPGALSREEAQKAASGQKVGTRTYYINTKRGNAKSWADSDDPASGYDSDETRYYAFAEAVWDGERSFMLGDADYEEISSYQTPYAAQESRASSEEPMPGVSIQLSRNLYHDDENGWGIEAAFNFQYARRNNVIKSASNWQIGRSTRTTGNYATKFTDRGLLGDMLTSENPIIANIPWVEGQYGTCVGQWDETTRDDAAIPIDLDSIETSWGESTESDAAFGSLDAKGDYENMEMMFLLQPYYDLFDWLSVNATLGVVVSRQNMEMSFAMYRNGVTEYRSDCDFSQWDVYGVAGLGLMAYYKGFTLSGDFMARFFDRDMDIKDKYYKGTVSRGDWMFRLGLGYEF